VRAQPRLALRASSLEAAMAVAVEGRRLAGAGGNGAVHHRVPHQVLQGHLRATGHHHRHL
jgi:hypothetical protein